MLEREVESKVSSPARQRHRESQVDADKYEERSDGHKVLMA